MKRALIAIIPLLLLPTTGCKLESIGSREFDLVAKSFETVSKASREINDEEEYYVGRAVAARLLADSPLAEDQRLTAYVNRVGLTVARHSDKPVTYRDYHFAVLNAPEANAFACPGGTILITRGMLELTRNEDELAAVLAHEVAHVNNRDGIGAISSSRWTEALTVIGSEAARSYGSREVAKLTTIFEGSIDDVVKTLVVNGYGRSQEMAADRGALTYLSRAGYDPRALQSFLERLASKGAGGEGGIFKTHPATQDRLEEVRGSMPASGVEAKLVDARAKRFRQAFE
jgi:predicted Zn-dependent protease